MFIFFNLQALCHADEEGPEPEATPRPMKECERTYNLEKEGPVKLDPSERECKWDIIGSFNCMPEISCKEINTRRSEDCEEEYLKVVDGLGGMKIFCGKVKKWKRPFKSSKGGRDLYISYVGREQGIKCTVKCGGRKAKSLPVVLNRPKVEVGCVCGLQGDNLNDRIVNGENTRKNEFPWQVAIVPKGTNGPICGASLINDRFILTAAHCSWFQQTPPENIEVLLHAYILDLTLMPDWKDVALGEQGSIRGHGWDLKNATDEDEGRIRLKVKKIINHPLFTEKYDFDVSLLRLENKLNLKTLGLAPICLPRVGDHRTYNGVKATVSGWGKPDELAGSTTRILQKLKVPIIATDECEDMMDFDLTDRMMCAGFEQGGQDACMGDSGGPLVARRKDNKHQLFQVGIVSWGEGCARKQRPGIYTRLTDVNQWIRRHTREADAVWCQDDEERPNFDD